MDRVSSRVPATPGSGKSGRTVRTALALAAACMAAYVWANRPVRTAVPWQHDLDAATSQADQQNRLIFLEFDSKSCAYCRKMDAEVFSLPATAELLRGFIPVRLDAGRNQRETRRFGVQALPRFFVLSSEGKVFASTTGAMTFEQLREFLKSARS